MWTKYQGGRYFDKNIIRFESPNRIYVKSECERTDDCNLGTTENCLDAFRTTLNEILLISNIQNRNVEVVTITIAAGEGHKPVSVLTDKFCKELAYTHLFPTGRFVYKIGREIAMGAVKYFNQRLVNHTKNLYWTWIAYFLLVLFWTNLASNNNQIINIAMRKEM